METNRKALVTMAAVWEQGSRFGSQGWELVGDAVYSNKMNLNNTRTMAANGVSTAEMFTFKRRKP